MQVTNDEGRSSFGGLVEMVRNLEDATSMSLFQYTKRSTINSRVFIEKTLAGEEILTPLMLNIMNLYTGLILTATCMNQYVTSTKRVRDMMSVVATESYNQPPVDLDACMESFFQQPKMDVGWQNSTVTDDNAFEDSGGGQVVDPETRIANLPSGRIIQVEFANPSAGRRNAQKIDLQLNLQPTYIPTDVAQQFVELHFSPSLKQRWLQMTTGEISFWKDFILHQDQRKRRIDALRHDKTGTLREMIERKENNLSRAWLKLTTVMPEYQNIANSILIFDKNNLQKVCSRSGLKLTDYRSRQAFLDKTFVMMMCVVDPMYNSVDMYYHGLQNTSTFTFDQIKRNSQTEKVDLMSVMKTYAQGMAPKF